jgi:hypothetical protein
MVYAAACCTHPSSDVTTSGTALVLLACYTVVVYLIKAV